MSHLRIMQYSEMYKGHRSRHVSSVKYLTSPNLRSMQYSAGTQAFTTSHTSCQTLRHQLQSVVLPEVFSLEYPRSKAKYSWNYLPIIFNFIKLLPTLDCKGNCYLLKIAVKLNALSREETPSLFAPLT